MEQYVFYTLSADDYFGRILSVVDSSCCDAETVLEDYYSLVHKFKSRSNFRMDFKSSLTRLEQLDLYLRTEDWRRFKTDRYNGVVKILNLTDRTFYETLKDEDCLHFSSVGGEPS